MDNQICQECGNVFSGRKRKYCCEACRIEFNRKRVNAERRVGAAKPLNVCQYCGKVFDGHRADYCSSECRKAAISEAEKLERKERVIRRGPRKCIICGKEFYNSYERTKVCSAECRREMKRQNDSVRSRCRPWKPTPAYRENHMPMQEYLESLHTAKQERIVREQAEKQAALDERTRMAECPVCGSVFITSNPSQITCSHACSKAWAKKREREYKEHRIPDEQMVDRDITLEGLYTRDHGTCYICGCECNWKDRNKRKNICGPTYPSIDHIIPVSRGGLHAWNNVRLACRKCNIEKSDKLPENAEELIPANAYELKREVNPNKKAVEQYTIAGILIAVYESTAEAERQTGIKAKGIQNCARGECETRGGYIWKYV